jgi:hypothetical protein
MKTYEPIQLAHAVGSRHAYYANINGITKGSITCYFDEQGSLTATTLYSGGAKQEELLQNIIAHINEVGVHFPSAKEQN